ncbi:hypothetical protein [Chitinimonas koreensis]|uniref:hypothetical protein n=1 Tax=Chitinimonas koreensis TaxID=356302 RepID=UPI000403D93D|nr:hypothetical protein [Chitinimonas koreensis]QNM96418.1 hypothetical protein H9L41_21960 [Chitinimonas koreensis]
MAGLSADATVAARQVEIDLSNVTRQPLTPAQYLATNEFGDGLIAARNELAEMVNAMVAQGIAVGPTGVQMISDLHVALDAIQRMAGHLVRRQCLTLESRGKSRS